MILVATDFSVGADEALDKAIYLARRLGEPIEVCHVHPPRIAPVPPTLDIARLPPGADEVAAAEVALAERVARVKDADVPCEGHSRFGLPAAEVVARVAELAPRFVVVGRRGAHSALQHLLVGSVAEEIMNHARCPVMIVPGPPN